MGRAGCRDHPRVTAVLCLLLLASGSVLGVTERYLGGRLNPMNWAGAWRSEPEPLGEDWDERETDAAETEFMPDARLAELREEFKHVFKYTDEVGSTSVVVAFNSMKIEDVDVSLFLLDHSDSRRPGAPIERAFGVATVSQTVDGGIEMITDDEKIGSCENFETEGAKFRLEFSNFQFWVNPILLGKLQSVKGYAGKAIGIIPKRPCEAGVLVNAKVGFYGGLGDDGRLSPLDGSSADEIRICAKATASGGDEENPVYALFQLLSWGNYIPRFSLSRKLQDKVPELVDPQVTVTAASGDTPPHITLISGLPFASVPIPSVYARAFKGSLMMGTLAMSAVGDNRLQLAPKMWLEMKLEHIITTAMSIINPGSGDSIRDYVLQLLRLCRTAEGGCGTVNTILLSVLASAALDPDSDPTFEGDGLRVGWERASSQPSNSKDTSFYLGFERLLVDWSSIKTGLPTDWALVETLRRKAGATSEGTKVSSEYFRGKSAVRRWQEFSLKCEPDDFLMVPPSYQDVPSELSAAQAQLRIPGTYKVTHTIKDDADGLNWKLLAYIACGGDDAECLGKFTKAFDFITGQSVCDMRGSADHRKLSGTMVHLDDGHLSFTFKEAFVMGLAGFELTVPEEPTITPDQLRRDLGWGSD